MATEEGLVVDKYGQIILSSTDLRELLLQGKNISHLNVKMDDDIRLYQQYQADLLPNVITLIDKIDDTLSVKDFYEKKANEWIFPAIYQQIDVLSWLLDKCKTDEEVSRVNLEYVLFEKHNLVMLLRLFIFLVDYMRKNKFVWGVGRGSSVSSYILYLIGVHRVNSLKYSLQISDYLK